MSEPRIDRRKGLVATLPCGCYAIVMTTEDPDETPAPPPYASIPPYKASALDISEFYREVHKRARRKRNPLVLTVSEWSGGPPKLKDQCEVCRPSVAAASGTGVAGKSVEPAPALFEA